MNPTMLPTNFLTAKSWLGYCLALYLVCGISSLYGQEKAQEKPADLRKYTKPVVIKIEGPITGVTDVFFRRAISQAREQKVDLIVVEIDSPGGLLETSLFIAHTLRDVDFAHTVAYIPDEAISGGAIIALGCDEIWLSEFGQIGDAGPVGFGLDGQFRHAPEKIRSYLVQQIRQLAEAKNRPPAIAEAMVDMNSTVYRVLRTSDGTDWYLNEAELNSLSDPNAFEKKEPVLESRPQMFLTVGGARAVELKLANALAANRTELFRKLDSTDDVDELNVIWIDRTIFVLNRPFVTALLLIIGLVALYFEFSMPGVGVGGIVSLLCFSIFFWSHFLGGTAGWLEVVLFLLGIILLLTEIFVIPGFGVAGISGVALIVVSLTMALQDYGVPSDAEQWRRTIRGLILIMGTFLGVMLLVFGLIRYARVFPALRGITLEPPRPEEIAIEETLFTDASHNVDGHASLPDIGTQGITESVLRPAGKAKFGERIYDVMSEGDFVEAHTAVIVVKKQAQVLLVRKLEV